MNKMANDLEELSIRSGKLVDSEGREVKVEQHVNIPIFVQGFSSKDYDEQFFLERLAQYIGPRHEHANAFLRGDAVSLSDITHRFGYSVKLYQIKKA